MNPSSLLPRFWSKVEKTPTCWLWTGAKTHNGYGSTTHEGKFWQSHRLSYTAHVGPIPDGMVIDHLCRVTNCVNPTHLQAVSQHVNILRGESLWAINARKTHCHRGHDLAADGYLNGRGKRICRPCRVIRNEQYRARHALSGAR